MKSIKFYSDPGHGWAETTIQEIKDLGIECDISSFSYRRGNKVYLEEDCDLSRYMKALGFAPDDCNVKYAFIDEHTNQDSEIRTFRPYYID